MSEKARHAVLFAVLTAASGFLAATGEPWGFAGLVFFGGGGLVCLLPAREGRSAVSGPRHGTLSGARRHTARPAGLVFPARRGAAAMVAAGAAVFVLTGGFLLLQAVPLLPPAAGAGPPWGVLLGAALGTAGAASVLFFGLCGAVALRTVLGPGGGIALLPEGVYARAPGGTVWIRWENLAAASSSVAPAAGGPYLALTAVSPDACAVSGLNRWLQRANRRRYGMDAGYPGSQLAAAVGEAADTIRRYHRDPAARARLGDPAEAAPPAAPVGGHSTSPPFAAPAASPAPVPPPVRSEEPQQEARHLADAEGLMAYGRWQEAEDLLRQAAHAGDPGAAAQLGNTLWARGEYERAEELLRPLADTGHAEAATYLAMVLEGTDRLQEAEDRYREAAAIGDTAAMACLGSLYARTGRPDRAEPWWRSAAEHGDGIAMGELGVHLIAGGRRAEGETWLHRAAADHPERLRDAAQTLRAAGFPRDAEVWERRAGG